VGVFYGTQWKVLPVPAPVQAPDGQPAQAAQCAPDPHCASLVHQHGTPAAVHALAGDVAVLQAPIGQAQALATDVAVRQSLLSAGVSPVHEPEHCELPLTHLPLEQFESATQRHALWAALSTGVGVRLVVHEEPPLPAQATELGGGWQP
jgi:hypothetical protein